MEKFQNTHPGGSENIEDIIGKDGTDLYMEAHEDSQTAHKYISLFLPSVTEVVPRQSACQIPHRHSQLRLTLQAVERLV